MSHIDRVYRLQAMMRKKGYEILILTDSGSLAYVSGIFSAGAWHGGEAIIIPKRGSICRVLNIAERGRHETEGWIQNLVYWHPPFAGHEPKSFIDTVAQTVGDMCGFNSTVGVEMDTIPWPWMEELKKLLPSSTIINATMDIKLKMGDVDLRHKIIYIIDTKSNEKGKIPINDACFGTLFKVKTSQQSICILQQRWEALWGCENNH